MHPIHYSAPLEEEGRSRLTVFFRYFLIIPWAIVAVFYGLAAYFVAVFAWFALLFTGRYPEGAYRFNSGFVRFHSRIMSWGNLLTDEWPPFDGKPSAEYPVRTYIPEPLAEYSRAKVFFRILYGIPVMILNYVMQVISGIVAFVAWLAIVILGRLPEGLYKPLRAAISYQVKAVAFWFLITETYPPFWQDEAEEVAQFPGGDGQPTVPAQATPPPPPPPPAAAV